MEAEHIENGIDFPPFRVPITRYRTDKARATAVVVPAMGTRAVFYQPFAEALVERGFDVLVPEIPGTGESRPRPSRRYDYGYRELVAIYLPALVAEAGKSAAGRPVILMGHSLGAHIGAMAIKSGHVNVQALVTVAGGNIHYRNWSGAGAIKVRFAGVLFPLLTRLFGYLPGQHVGFGGPQARTLIREWATVIRTGHFPHFGEEDGRSEHIPALCIAYEADDYAPEPSVAALAALLHGDMKTLPVDGEGSRHSGWAKSPARTVSTIENWLASSAKIKMPGPT